MNAITMKRWFFGAATAVALCAGGATVAPAPAYAKAKTHKDDVRGFECRVEDSWEQVPPKPGTDDLHIAGEWKDPSPKYQRFSGDQPTFRVIWTVTRKGDAPAEEAELPAWAKDLPPELQEQVRLMQSGTKETLEGDVNKMLKWYDRLFGEYKPLEEHYAARKKPEILKTKDGLEVDVVEINYQKKRPKDPEPNWWMWVGRTGWEDDHEKVEIGFYGYVDMKFAKDFRKQFELAAKSFKLRDVQTPTTAEEEATAGLSEAERKIQEFIDTKIIKGWSYERTPHYLVVYDDDVDKKIVNRVTKEIEALRAQVYEVMFPPDHPVEAVSIVRVCESRDQYSAYGAPGGSAGYWSPYHEELVLYQDQNDKKDAIRVLYHEAFHQYIYYSVGEVSPHSWFNEGHGDFFSGHVYKSGRFKREPFGWRIGEAKEGKRRWKEGLYRFRAKRNRRGEPEEKAEASDGPAPTGEDRERLTLAEWLTWRQPEYYGNNDFEWSVSADGNPRPIPGGMNYALGWSFIYFLRTTKNEEYQKILPTYFNTLKAFVTQDRAAREKAAEAAGLTGGEPGEPGVDGEPVEPGEPATGGEPPAEGGEDTEAGPPNTSDTTDEITKSQWHGEALKEATRGLDLEQLEKDWLEHSW